MADPLSVIASVISVATAGIVIATTLHNLVDRFGTAFNDIEIISSDLNGFSIVLREVANKLNVPASQRIASDRLIDGLTKLMETCKVLFVDIRRMISKVYGDKITQFKTKVRWIFRETRIRGIKATLECQKSTLNLMLHILSDDQSTFQRRILENLSREHEHKLKVIQEIGKENEALEKENAALKEAGKKKGPASETGGQSMVYLPGAVSHRRRSGPEGLKRSATVVLSNIVPRQKQEAQENITSSPRLEGGSHNQQTGKPSEEPVSDSMYTAYYVPPENRYTPEDPGMAVGVSATAQQKGEIDLLLSKWIQKPAERPQGTMASSNPHRPQAPLLGLPGASAPPKPYGTPALPSPSIQNDPPQPYSLPPSYALPPVSDEPPTTYGLSNSYGPPTTYGQYPTSSSSYGLPNSIDRTSVYSPPDLMEIPISASNSGNFVKFPTANTEDSHLSSKSGIDESLDNSRFRALETEYQDILSQIKIQLALNEAHRAETDTDLKNSVEKLLLVLKRDTEAMEKTNEKLRSDVEKRLMQCEADEERRKSVEAELERSRQEYAMRIRDQPSQSHEPLERHIQNMQDRLARDRVELGNLSTIRKDLLKDLRLVEKDHEIQLATKKEECDRDVEKVKGEMASKLAVDEQLLKKLETKKADLESELKREKEELKNKEEALKSARTVLPVTMSMNNYERQLPINDMPPYPVSYTREFKVPEWLDDASIEAELNLDDDNAAEENVDKIPLGPINAGARSEPDASVHISPEELPTTQPDAPQSSASSAPPTSKRPPMPTVESSSSSQASSHWRFESESPGPNASSSSTTTFEQATHDNPLSTPESPQEAYPPAAANRNPPTMSDMSPSNLMCRRPAWKPPLTCQFGLDTLASILSQSAYQLLYFKASQDAYHFFLSASPTPFYIIDLVPSDLTTHQTSTIQWTIIPKIWASKKALVASGYVFEEDVVGQVWIRKELNWHQVLQLFDFSCGILDNRLNGGSRRVLGKRAEEKEEWSTAHTPSRLLSRLRGLKDIKVLEELHGGFFDSK